jgi:hypothetical protein
MQSQRWDFLVFESKSDGLNETDQRDVILILWDMVLHADSCLSLLWSKLVHCPMTSEWAFWMLSSSTDLCLMCDLSSPLNVILETSSSAGGSASGSMMIGDAGTGMMSLVSLMTENLMCPPSTMLVLSADVFGHSFQSINKRVSLFAVTAVKDAARKFGAVASELSC